MNPKSHTTSSASAVRSRANSLTAADGGTPAATALRAAPEYVEPAPTMPMDIRAWLESEKPRS